MKLIHLNSDRGIHPKREKGAAVHLRAMRESFASLGAGVIAIDEPDQLVVSELLRAQHAASPIDFVYERLALGAYAGAEFASLNDVPHVLEVNAPLDEEELRFRDVSSRAELDLDRSRMQHALAGAQTVLCVSRACADWALSHGATSSSVVVAGNGVDAERFHPRRREEDSCTPAIPEDAFVLGFHGRLRPWHAFERLVRAARELRDRGLPVHLSIVGKGDFADQIADSLPPESWTHVEWVDHAEVGRLVARFDVLPLCYDPAVPCYFSPLKLLEGMAAGAVAVVPDLGDLSAAVGDGWAGCVYDPHDPNALANCIEQLYHDVERRLALASAGRRVAEERSWIRIAELVLERVGVRA